MGSLPFDCNSLPEVEGKSAGLRAWCDGNPVFGSVIGSNIIGDTTALRNHEERKGKTKDQTYVITSFSLDCLRRILVSWTTSEILGAAEMKEQGQRQGLSGMKLRGKGILEILALTPSQKFFHGVRCFFIDLVKRTNHLSGDSLDLGRVPSRTRFEDPRVFTGHAFHDLDESSIFSERVPIELAHVRTRADDSLCQ